MAALPFRSPAFGESLDRTGSCIAGELMTFSTADYYPYKDGLKTAHHLCREPAHRVVGNQVGTIGFAVCAAAVATPYVSDGAANHDARNEADIAHLHKKFRR